MKLDNRVTFATPEGVALELILAGLGSRFLARLLDTVIQGAIIIALLIGVGVTHAPGWIGAIVFIFVFLVVFAYDVALETLNNGRTVGKQVAGIRVTGASGEPIRFLPSAVRNILRLVDFLPVFYLVGSVAIVTTARDQRLGDLAAGTIVTRDRFPGLSNRIAPITVPLDAVATWDVSAVSPAEVRAVRQFLERRLELRAPARTYFANDLASRVAPKVAGIPAGSHPEYVLEGIVLAKQSRS